MVDAWVVCSGVCEGVDGSGDLPGGRARLVLCSRRAVVLDRALNGSSKAVDVGR